VTWRWIVHRRRAIYAVLVGLVPVVVTVMSGQEVLAQLRAEPGTREIPVVILSEDATPSQVSRVLQQGAHAYLTEPLVVAQFLTVLDELLARAVR